MGSSVSASISIEMIQHRSFRSFLQDVITDEPEVQREPTNFMGVSNRDYLSFLKMTVWPAST
jgi:hypothetical protein